MENSTVMRAKTIFRRPITYLSFLLMATVLLPCEAQEIIYKKGSTQKISQLVGDFDRHLGQATQNQTNTRYNLWGTDLGIPFQHNDKTYFLFGDVPGPDDDPIAYSSDTDPSNGLDLTFLTNNAGNYQPIIIPGIDQGAFEVPVEGISLGGTMYVYHTTDTLKRLVLAKSIDDGNSFQLVEDSISTRFFLNLSVVQVDAAAWPGLPTNGGTGLILFGSGSYRNSDLYLAYQPADFIENKNEILYFNGTDIQGMPAWSQSEEKAAPLFEHPCIGEFSVTHNPFIKKWILLYNCGDPRGINFRTADFPWGPWSEAQLLFDPWIDQGYCHFMHVDWRFRNCDQVHDQDRENEWGGEYGPYQFEHLTTGDANQTTIYYTMSTWNPYTIVLMQSQLLKTTTQSDQLNQHDLQMFPNPMWKHTTLKLPNGHFDHLEFYLYDMNGVLLLKKNLDQNTTVIHRHDLPAGVFIYQIKNIGFETVYSGKLIIQSE